MHNHAPLEYICPFCLLILGKESVESQPRQTDIIFQSADVTASMATKRYPNHQGHVLIIPNQHFPAGDQNIWHYHLHVIPLYNNDEFHNAQKSPFETDERAKYAQKLRSWSSESKI